MKRRLLKTKWLWIKRHEWHGGNIYTRYTHAIYRSYEFFYPWGITRDFVVKNVI
jgi:hypothetical protein